MDDKGRRGSVRCDVRSEEKERERKGWILIRIEWRVFLYRNKRRKY